MEALKIKAYKTFVRQHDEIAEWYATQLGQKAMQKYLDDLESTIHRLTHFPQMGIIDERRSTNKWKYYSFYYIHIIVLFIGLQKRRCIWWRFRLRG